MRTGQRHWAVRVIAMTIVVSMAGIELLAAPARAQQIDQYRKLTTPKPFSELKPGLTQCLTPERWKQVDAKRALQAAEKESKRPAVRTLSGKEMDSLKGRGIYRNKYFAGTLPWHRSVRDANLCNGNLFKFFTDLQVSPAKGAGLALQRTYNSQDDRIGPFGIGWTHAYDIHFEEDGSDNVPRSDFFGGKHKYHRDADGLYSPPAYLYDKLDSVYQDALVNGNVVPISDNDTSIDGTVKHFVAATGNVRYCTSIVDRYGNQTTLSYQDNTPGTPKLLSTVTDPSGRALTFTWTNLGTGMNAIQRITRVDGPQYSVTYAYNVDANLSSVTLDPGVTSHLNRTTTFGYTTYSDANGSETGLLASVGDALGHTVSYTYALNTTTNTVSITTVTEPAGVTAGNATRTLTWTISGPGPGQGYGAYTSTYTNSAVTVNNGTFVAMDTFLRTTKHFLSPFDYYSTGYDTANNVTGGTTYTGDYPLSDTTRTNITTSSQATYGYHGNVVTAQIAGIPGTNGTAYYDASQYFQKKSMTDANGHTSTLNVGTNTDVNPGNLVLPRF